MDWIESLDVSKIKTWVNPVASFASYVRNLYLPASVTIITTQEPQENVFTFTKYNCSTITNKKYLFSSCKKCRTLFNLLKLDSETAQQRQEVIHSYHGTVDSTEKRMGRYSNLRLSKN